MNRDLKRLVNSNRGRAWGKGVNACSWVGTIRDVSSARRSMNGSRDDDELINQGQEVDEGDTRHVLMKEESYPLTGLLLLFPAVSRTRSVRPTR